MPRIPDAILNKLRCTNCKSWLSCGPVRVLENGGSVCGRCNSITSLDQYRHFAYEVLACYFQFPCKHWENYCSEELSFKEVIDHENECSYAPGCCFCCCHPVTACRSRRKIDLSAGILLEIIPEQFLDYLRCGICAGYLSSTPVLVAQDGTSACHRCSLQQGLIKRREYRRHVVFETFAEMMIFPCVFRYEGCTNLFRFGEPMHRHEMECMYNANRLEHNRSQAHSSDYGRGSVDIHKGPFLSSVTPTAALFTLLTGKPLDREMFSEEFQKHKEILATRWSHHQDEATALEGEQEHSRRLTNMSIKATDVITKAPLGRTDSIHLNENFRNSFINELKLKQSFRKNRQFTPHDNISVVDSSNLSTAPTNVRY